MCSGNFDIIIQAGQSNAVGCGDELVQGLFAKNDFAFYFNNDMTITKAEGRVHENGICGDFSLSFAQKYAANDLANNRKILIVRSAVVGTGFSDNRWKESDDLFLQMMKMTTAALKLNPKNRLVALLWHQGETDALNNVSYDVHYKNLDGLVELVRTAFAVPNLPFVAGGFVQDWADKNPDICAPVISAIRDVCSNIKNGAFVESSGLKSKREEGSVDDDIHFCNEALYLLGQRYYDAYTKGEA